MEAELSDWFLDSEPLSPMFGELHLYTTPDFAFCGIQLVYFFAGPHVSSPQHRSETPQGVHLNIVIEKVTCMSLFLYLITGQMAE